MCKILVSDSINASINIENEFVADVMVNDEEPGSDSKMKLCPLIPPGT